MTTAGPPDRPRRERALSRPGTKPPDNTRNSRAIGGQANDSSRPNHTERAGTTTEADGGRAVRDKDTTPFRTYTDDEYGYSLAHPANWTGELDADGGVMFGTSRPINDTSRRSRISSTEA